MAKTSKRGLGRGFEALLSDDFDKSLVVSSGERVQQLSVTTVSPNVDQPRRHFDETSLAELAESISNHGIVLPLVVRPLKNGTYQIVAGERRWRAAQLAKLKTVPAVVRSMKEIEELEIALIENVQRVDLSPLEQAASLVRLHEQFSVSYEAIAKRLGKAASTVNNMVRLLQLPSVVQAALAEHKISEGHARAILALKADSDSQAKLLQAIIDNGWSVRQAERYVTSHKQGVRETEKVAERIQTETPETKILSKKFGTPVLLKRTARGGRLEITFKTDTELAAILKSLSS